MSVVQPPDNGFLLWASALVFIMTPGLALCNNIFILVYSGLSRSKNALHMIMVTMCTMCVVTLQVFSLIFVGSSFIGNSKYFGLNGVGIEPLLLTAPAVSGISFMLFQMQFATITAALIFGSVSERIRLLPTLLFIFIWTTLVYDPIAYWTFSWRGWLRNLGCLDAATSLTPCGTGSLDFAGGGPVHMTSGFAGLAFCLYIGKRISSKGRVSPPSTPTNRSKDILDSKEFLPHHIVNVFIGTALLWFGWYGFNGGSSVSNTARGGMAAAVTQIAAVTSALSWPLLDIVFDSIFKRRRGVKFSAVGFCSGAVAGLVAVTPASGFIAPWAAIVFGFFSGTLCNLACRIKDVFGFDDSLDAFAVHGIGGLIGSLLTGIFAQSYIPRTLDGTSTVLGGWVEGHWIQLWWQLAGSLATSSYSFVATYLIVMFTDVVTGYNLRLKEDEENEGGDMAELGETAYSYSHEHGQFLKAAPSVSSYGNVDTLNMTAN